MPRTRPRLYAVARADHASGVRRTGEGIRLDTAMEAGRGRSALLRQHDRQADRPRRRPTRRPWRCCATRSSQFEVTGVATNIAFLRASPLIPISPG